MQTPRQKQKIVCIVNQKGGVGKTTTTHNLARSFVELGHRVLIIDLDPQTNLTHAANAQHPNHILKMIECTRQKEAITTKDYIQRILLPGKKELHIIAGTPDLSLAPLSWKDIPSATHLLKETLHHVKEPYDFIFVDTAPTLNILSLNALTAADSLIIPATADIFTLQGIGQLLETVQTVKTYTNKTLEIVGILITRHNPRTIHSASAMKMLEETAKLTKIRILDTRITEAIAAREAQTLQKAIQEHAPHSKIAQEYIRAAEEIQRIIWTTETNSKN